MNVHVFVQELILITLHTKDKIPYENSISSKNWQWYIHLHGEDLPVLTNSYHWRYSVLCPLLATMDAEIVESVFISCTIYYLCFFLFFFLE